MKAVRHSSLWCLVLPVFLLCSLIVAACDDPGEIPKNKGDRWCCNCNCCEQVGAECVPVEVGLYPVPNDECARPSCWPPGCDDTESGIPPVEICEYNCRLASNNPAATVCEDGAEPSHLCIGGCNSEVFLIAYDKSHFIDWSRSTAYVSVNGGLDRTVWGYVGTAGGDCPGQTCDFYISYMNLMIEGFNINGDQVRDPTAVLKSSVATQVDGNGNFTLPEGSTDMWVRFTYNGEIGGDTISLPPGFSGTYDSAEAKLSLEGNFSIGDLSVRLRLYTTPQNLPPVAVAKAPSVIECESPNGALVFLDGSDSYDPDPYDYLKSVMWIENFRSDRPSKILAETEKDYILFPLGSHEVSLWVRDSNGAEDVETIHIDVVDTTPPEIDSVTVSPDCLWPPNHKYVKLDLGEEIDVGMTDKCDPSPYAVIVGATSSEPDNGLGDGDTVNDVSAGTSAVCLRSERSGTGEGRTYSINLGVADASGNRADASVEVSVPHDQHGHKKCRKIPNNKFLEELDPLCISENYESTGNKAYSRFINDSEVPQGSGCGTVSKKANPNLAIFLLPFLIVAALFMRARKTSKSSSSSSQGGKQ